MPDETGTNPATGLPHTISLGAVLQRVRLAPHEISSLLASWGASHDGTPQADMATKLRAAAQAVVNPVTYGADPPPTPVVTPVAQATPGVAPAFAGFRDDTSDAKPALAPSIRDTSGDKALRDDAAIQHTI